MKLIVFAGLDTSGFPNFSMLVGAYFFLFYDVIVVDDFGGGRGGGRTREFLMLPRFNTEKKFFKYVSLYSTSIEQTISVDSFYLLSIKQLQ